MSKQKHFSTPLREVVMGLASRPLVFVERVLVLTLGSRPTFGRWVSMLANSDAPRWVRPRSTHKRVEMPMSIRSIERFTGVHRDTIMRLLLEVGEKCDALMRRKLKDLTVNRIQCDELYCYVAKRERRTSIEGSVRRT